MERQCTWELFLEQLPLTVLGMLLSAAFLGLVLGIVSVCWQDVVFLFFLFLISLMDIRYNMIFNRVLLPFVAMGLVNAVVSSQEEWLWRCGGALTGGGILWLVRWCSHHGMGGGDVKLAFVLGLWLGFPLIVEALWLSFVIGGGWAAILLYTGRKQRKDRMPFGPFLCFGSGILYFYGTVLCNWYGGCYG